MDWKDIFISYSYTNEVQWEAEEKKRRLDILKGILGDLEKILTLKGYRVHHSLQPQHDSIMAKFWADDPSTAYDKSMEYCKHDIIDTHKPDMFLSLLKFPQWENAETVSWPPLPSTWMHIELEYIKSNHPNIFHILCAQDGVLTDWFWDEFVKHAQKILHFKEFSALIKMIERDWLPID